MNWTEAVTIFLLGVSVGASAMWWYFVKSDLIRNREEWERATKDIER